MSRRVICCSRPAFARACLMLINSPHCFETDRQGAPEIPENHTNPALQVELSARHAVKSLLRQPPCGNWVAPGGRLSQSILQSGRQAGPSGKCRLIRNTYRPFNARICHGYWRAFFHRHQGDIDMKRVLLVRSSVLIILATSTSGFAQRRGAIGDVLPVPRPAASATTSSTVTFSGNDAYAITKTLEPVGMARCTDRNGWPADDCMTQGGSPGEFSNNFAFSGSRSARIYYQFSGCQIDKRGCKALKLSVVYGTYSASQTGEPFGGPPEVAAWNATKPDCTAIMWNGDATIFQTIPLSSTTTLASIQNTRARLATCKARFDTFLKAKH